MRYLLFLASILFLITGGVLLFGGTDKIVAPGRGVAAERQAGEPYFLLHRAMKMADVSIFKGDLHYWASLEQPGRGSLTSAELEYRADALLRRLFPRFVPAFATTRVKRDSPAMQDAVQAQGGSSFPDFILVEREGKFNHDGRLRLLLQGMAEEGERTAHLFITISEEGEARRLGKLARLLPALMEADARSSSLTFSLTGRIFAPMAGEDMERLALDVTGKLGARQKESIREEFIVSVTGYTPLLQYGGNGGNGPLPVNLNLALRPDAEGKSTIIWDGTPSSPGCTKKIQNNHFYASTVLL